MGRAVDDKMRTALEPALFTRESGSEVQSTILEDFLKKIDNCSFKSRKIGNPDLVDSRRGASSLSLPHESRHSLKVVEQVFLVKN